MKLEWKPEQPQEATEREFSFVGSVLVVSAGALELCRLASHAFGLSTEYADKRLKSARRIAEKNFPGSAQGARESADARLQQMELPARGKRVARDTSRRGADARPSEAKSGSRPRSSHAARASKFHVAPNTKNKLKP